MEERRNLFFLTSNHRISHLQSSPAHRLVLHHWLGKRWGGINFFPCYQEDVSKAVKFCGLKKKRGKELKLRVQHNALKKKKKTSNQPLRSLRACKTHSAYTEWKFSGKPATKSLI